MLSVIFMIIVLVLLALPFLPLKLPFTFFWYNFPEEKRPKNLIYIASTLLVVLATVLLMPYVIKLADWFADLELIRWLLSLVPHYAQYSAIIFEAFFANVLFCAVVLLVHGIVGAMFGLMPKLSIKRVKEYFAKLRERAKQRKQERLKRKQEKKKSKEQNNDPQDPQNPQDPQDPQNPPPPQQPQEPEKLPDHLFPKPQPRDFVNKVKLFGAKTVVGDKKNKSATPQTANVATVQDEPKDFSVKQFIKWLFSLFYVRHEDGWYAQPQCKKVAKHLRNFLILTGIAYLVIFTLLMIPVFFQVKTHADTFYDLMVMLVDNCYLYPAVSLVLLTEIFWFMNGRVPKEPVQQISQTVTSQNGRVVDLDLVEQQLLQTYGKEYEVKSFYSGDVEGQERARIPVDVTDDCVLQNVLSFVESQRLVRNDDYLRGIKALQRGENTLFDAPLFTAVSLYLYPYLNIRISQGERMIVICQNEDEIPGIIENLREGFRRVQRAHACLWSVTGRKELRTDNATDILVVTPEDFLDERLFVEAKDFFQRVTIALLPDSDQVVMSNNYLCVVIAERMRQAVQNGTAIAVNEGQEKNVQYLFLSTRHTLNLARSLTEYFMLSRDVYNVQAEYAYGNTRLYVWRATAANKILLDNNAQTVKIETAISNIAQRNGIPKVSMFTKGAIFASQIDPSWLDTYDIFDRPIGFTVVSDDSYNLPGTIYTYSRYVGKEASVLHVISKPYMLRDYFYDSAVRSLYERPLMERGMLEHARMSQTDTILLLCRLMKGIPLTEFAAKMAQITGSFVDQLSHSAVEKLVDTCLTIAFGREATARQYGFTLEERVDETFNRVPYILIREEGILEHLMEETKLVTVQISSSHEMKVIPLFRRMLAQRYLPNQHMVIDHSNYKIQRIDFEKGIIYATLAQSVHNVPDQYVQLREYTLHEPEIFLQSCRHYAQGGISQEPANIQGSQRGVEGNTELRSLTMVRSLGALDIDSHTVAYYDSTHCPGQLDLMDSSVFSVKTDLHRKVGNAMYLRFAGDFAGDDRTTMTLAILLQEMMKTMFPDQHFCISVCPILRDPDSIYNHPDAHCRRIAQMYPKLRGWTEPEKDAVELLIIDDCQGGTGVLDVLYDPEAVYLGNILDMLCDYLDWLEKHPENAYLNFGAKNCPRLYELSRVRKLLDAFSRRYRREHDLFQSLQMGNCCVFCGKELSMDASYLWNNKYNVCSECNDEYVPSEEETGWILSHIRKFLDRRFGVTLDTRIKVLMDPQVDIADVDVEAKTIRLNSNLPLTMVHSEILRKAVSLWQIQYLRMTGEPEFQGQLLYVLLQYLEELEQYQRRKRFHSRALLSTDDESLGYCRLRQALQALSTDNSFRYMLDNFPKGSKPPVIKTEPKRSARTIDPGKVTHYFRDQADETERAIYDALVAGITDMVEEIDLSAIRPSYELAKKVWWMMVCDHPEFHWLDIYNWNYSYDQAAPDIVTAWIPHYYMDAAERQRRQQQIDDVLPHYLEGITEETGDFEAALMIYERLANELDYDSPALDRQKRRRAALERLDDEPDDLRSIYGALVMKRAVCVGYAYAFQYLLQRIGMECMLVRGVCTEGGRHAWNIINMEGNYYHMDVTWGDGSDRDPTKSSDEISYGYFGLTDEEISLTRNANSEPVMPACTENYCNYFVRNGLYFTAYDHMMVKEKLVNFLQDGKKTRVDLRFSNARVLDAARQQLMRNGGTQEVLRTTGRTGTYSSIISSQLHILSIFFETSANEEPSEPIAE